MHSLERIIAINENPPESLRPIGRDLYPNRTALFEGDRLPLTVEERRKDREAYALRLLNAWFPSFDTDEACEYCLEDRLRELFKGLRS